MSFADVAWLPNSLLKGIKYPHVVYHAFDWQEYSGYYVHGTNELHIVESDTMPSTIAHEFCHYLQWNNGTLGTNPKPFHIIGTYEETIQDYFLTQKDEYEALLFEYKYARDYLNDWWLNKLCKQK